jgi:hypothetical protein
MAAYQLAPLPAQIGVFDHFIARQTEQLILKVRTPDVPDVFWHHDTDHPGLQEKVMSLSGDSFDIKLANGQPLLKIQVNTLRLSFARRRWGRKVLGAHRDASRVD